MTMMELGKNLQLVNDAVAGFVAEGIATPQQEQFVTLPERCRRASELAEELSELLGGIAVDAEACVAAMTEYDPKGRRVESLTNLAKRAIYGTHDDELDQLPEVVSMVTSPSVCFFTEDIPPLATSLRNHAHTTKRIITTADRLGAKMQLGTEAVTENFAQNAATVDKIIQDYIART